jgi:hypothetical protein
MSRRLGTVAALVVLVVVAVLATRPVQPQEVRFADLAVPRSPTVPSRDSLSHMWLCPGLPINGGEGSGGDVIVLNVSTSPLTAQLSVLLGADSPDPVDLSVLPGERAVVDIASLARARFAGVMVEVFDGVAVVEQRARHPVGEAIAPCASGTSPTWFFADGSTASGTVEELILSNPYPGAAVVDLRFVTASGPRAPQALQGLVLAPRSTTVVRLGDDFAPDESAVAVSLRATAGQFVAGRSQHYLGGGRLGYTLALGAPAPDDQWWFPDGEIGPGITQMVSLYNPTATEVVADVVPLGIPLSDSALEPLQIRVPAQGLVSLEISGLGVIPQGRHGLLVSSLGEPSLVVEQAITRPAGDFVVTSVSMGVHGASPSRRWYAALGVEEPTPGALAVMNTTGVDAVITLSDLGPGGAVPLPEFDQLTLPAGGVVSIDLPAVAVGRPLIIESDVEVVAARVFPRRPGSAGRSVSLAVPT